MNGATLGSFIMSHEEVERNYEIQTRILRDKIVGSFCDFDNEMLYNLKSGKAVLISIPDEHVWSDFLRVVVSANGFAEKITVKQLKGDDLVRSGMLYVSTKKPDVDWEVIHHDFFLANMDNLLTTMKVTTRHFKDTKVSRIAAVAAAAIAF